MNIVELKERIAGALETSAELRYFENVKVDITKRISKGDNL